MTSRRSAKSVDLICLMTYDQNTRWTTPGPVAGWQWTLDNINYALQVVPKEKLSLGIPLYGYHWYTGAPIMTPAAREGELPIEKPNPRRITSARRTRCSWRTTGTAKIQWDDGRPHGIFLLLSRPDARMDFLYRSAHIPGTL